MNPPAPPAPQPKRGGNKIGIWVGVGCLALLVGIVVLGGGIYLLTSGMHRDSDTSSRSARATAERYSAPRGFSFIPPAGWVEEDTLFGNRNYYEQARLREPSISVMGHMTLKTNDQVARMVDDLASGSGTEVSREQREKNGFTVHRLVRRIDGGQIQDRRMLFNGKQALDVFFQGSEADYRRLLPTFEAVVDSVQWPPSNAADPEMR